MRRVSASDLTFLPSDLSQRLSSVLRTYPYNFGDASNILTEAILSEYESHLPFLCGESCVTTFEITHNYFGKLIRICTLFHEIKIMMNDQNGWNSFDDAVLKAVGALCQLIRRRVFSYIGKILNIREFDQLQKDLTCMVKLGGVLTTIDFHCFDNLGDIVCEILDYFHGKTSIVFENVKSMTDVALRAIRKKGIIDDLRVTAFRFRSLCNHLLDLIDLQSTYTIEEPKAFESIHHLALDMKLSPVALKDRDDIIIYASPSLIDDPVRARLFSTANVNSSSFLSSDILFVIRNADGLSEFLQLIRDQCLEVDESAILMQYALTAESGVFSAVTKSILELRPLIHKLQHVSGLKDKVAFNMVGAFENCRHSPICLRQNIEGKLSDYCALISDILASLSYEEKQALEVVGLIEEMDRSIIIAMSFMFEYLIDAAHVSETLQRTFTDQGFVALYWLNWHVQNYINDVDRAWTSFWLIKVLEMMIPVMALKNYERHPDWKASVEFLKEGFEKVAHLELDENESKMQAYIVDQGRTFIAKYERKRITTSFGDSLSSRFPDQPFLEIRGFFVFSLVNSSPNLVYKCLNLITRKLVVIKRLSKSSLKGRDSSKNEIDIIMSLKHPNVLSYQDFFENRDYLFLVTTYCEDKLVPRKRTENAVRLIGRQILNGLVYLHANHLVHRDLKPSNILKDGCGFFKIADFGEARLVDVNNRQKRFDLSNLYGTPAFMSPECLYHSNVEPSSDIWSFACIMVLLITGKPPWSSCENKFNILFHLGSSDNIPFAPADWQFRPELQKVLMSCLNRDPSKRPSAVELLNHPMFSDVPDSIV